MSDEVLVPWQSFFDDEALRAGRRTMLKNLVSRLSFNRRNTVKGRVQVRRSYDCSAQLVGLEVSDDQVLRATEVVYDCTCPRGWTGCEHVTALMMAHAAANGHPEPDADEVEDGRDALDARDNDDDEGESDDFWDEDGEEDDPDALPGGGLPSNLVVPIPGGRNAKAISFPGAQRTPPDKTPPVDRGEPPPTIEVANAYRGDTSGVWELNRWLTENLSRSAVGTSSRAADHHITYHLHRDQYTAGSWSCEVVAARRLKSGALGVLKRFRHHSATEWRSLPYATAEDCDLLRWLTGLHDPDRGYASKPIFSAATGVNGEAMTRLLSTGRCYVEDFSHPLALGPALELIPGWVERPTEPRPGQGKQSNAPAPWQLVLRRPDGSDVQLLPLDPPWYIADGKAGPVVTTLPAAQVMTLLKMPPVPASLLHAAVARLSIIVPGLPAAPLFIEAGTAAAIPTGHLVRWTPTVAEARGSRKHVPIEVVLFAVRYAGVIFDPNAQGPVTGADKGPILRDPPREAALQAQLRHLGLVPVHEISERTASHVWSLLPSSKPTLWPWVHQASVHTAQPGERIVLPPAILSALAAAGWTFSGGSTPPPTLALAAASIEARFHEPDDAAEGDWFRLDLGVRFGDERIDLTPIISALLADADPVARLPQVTLDGREWVCFSVPDGRVVRVPLDLLQRLVEHLTAIFDAPPGSGGWKTDPWQALSLDGLAGLAAVNGPRLKDLAKRLAGLVELVDAESPPGLLAELRPYQKRGLDWLQRLRAAGTGGVLADDMGLGKTVQAIAHLCAEAAAGRLADPALVVGPASMVGTWRRELNRFAPLLRITVLHGGDRARTTREILRDRPQVVITTYATLLRDAAQAEAITWSLVIADEAQAIGNPTVKSGHVVRRLKTAQRIALTGTPMSNHLGELHTLMSWLVPGLLGSAARFDKAFRRPIEKDGDRLRAEILRKRIAPFLLRRTKEVVAPELPPRTESVVTIELEGGQRALYESVRLAMDERIRAVVAAKGLARSHIEVLEALTKLRLCCCDPRLVKTGDPKRHADLGSAKLDWLRESLPELIEEGRRILLFSQFTSWLDLIEADVLKPAGITWLRLDGSTVDRDTPVQRFQRGEAPLFLLSLKAGGTGLTLTAADTVILADPWWNPAAEAQAADRAHRIGQDKPVFVWRLVAEGTVEERILALQARKRAIMSAMLDEQGQSVPSFTEEDLRALLAPLPD
jgi:superfamily II DNA or RNA helicase